MSKKPGSRIVKDSIDTPLTHDAQVGTKIDSVP
jgi:hypothetical protein